MPKMIPHRLLLCLLPLLFSCTENNGKEKSGPIAATVGDSTIPMDALETYLSARPLKFSEQDTKKAVAGRLDEMITAEVLFQEAINRKLDRDPETRLKIQGILTQKLLEEQVVRPVQAREIGETELKKYYDEHRHLFSHGEQIRLADIFISVSSDASTDEREAKKRKAQAILIEAIGARDDRFGFATLIERHSEKHPRYAIGDTAFFDIDGKPAGLHENLVKAGFGLRKNGDMAERVIETPLGFHVIMRIGKKAAKARAFKDVARSIERSIRNEALQKGRAEFVAMLKKKRAIKIEDATVEMLAEKLGSPRKDGSPPKLPSHR